MTNKGKPPLTRTVMDDDWSEPAPDRPHDTLRGSGLPRTILDEDDGSDRDISTAPRGIGGISSGTASGAFWPPAKHSPAGMRTVFDMDDDDDLDIVLSVEYPLGQLDPSEVTDSWLSKSRSDPSTLPSVTRLGISRTRRSM